MKVTLEIELNENEIRCLVGEALAMFNITKPFDPKLYLEAFIADYLHTLVYGIEMIDDVIEEMDEGK